MKGREKGNFVPRMGDLNRCGAGWKILIGETSRGIPDGLCEEIEKPE